MKNKNLILSSILSVNPSKLTEEIISITGEGGVDGIHIDYMKPPFVPNSTIFDPFFLKSLKNSLLAKNIRGLFYDVHIMSNNLDELLKGFSEAGADLITVHYEASSNLNKTIKKIKGFNKMVGIALNPETSIKVIGEYIKEIDLLLIMTVNPGRGGQSLIENCLYKIEEAKKVIEEKAPNVILEVDGGINLENIKTVADRGANAFVSGSTIFNSPNRLETIYKMREIIFKI